MTEERIDIVVNDKIQKTIRSNIASIGTAASKAHTDVLLLQNSLKKFDSSSLSKLTNALKVNSNSLVANARANAINSAAANAASLSAQRLATEQQKTAKATIEVQIAQTRLSQLQQMGAVAAQRLATEQAKTALALQRTATAAQQTITAQNNAAASALRLASAQQKASQSSKGLSNDLTAVAGAVGGFISARALGDTADAFTNFTNRLNTVSESSGQLDELRERVAALARETRSDLLSTTDGFVRFDKALRTSGAGQEETLRFTETLNKALVTAGRSTSEVSSVVIQLGQALTSGRLQGDEFRSLSENLPIEALDAFAKVLGIGRDQLKAASTDGKITAEVIRKAFALIAESTDAAFEKSIPTLEQAWTVLRNNATIYIGQIDQAAGISRTFGAAIMFVADNMAFFAPILGGVAVLLGIAVVGAFFAATASVWAFTGALLANPFGLLAVGLTTAGLAVYNFREVIISGFNSALDAIESFINQAIYMLKNFLSSINDVMLSIDLMTMSLGGKAFLPRFNIGPDGPLQYVNFGRIGGSDPNGGLAGGGDSNLRPEGNSTLGGAADKNSGTKKLTEDQTALKKIYDETIGSVRQLVIDTAALNRAYEEGWLGLDEYNKRMTDLGLKAIDLKMVMGDATWADVMLGAIGKVVEGYRGMMAGLSESFGSFFTSLTDGFANSIGRAIVYGDDLGESLRDVARSALSELISGIVKLGMQWLLMNTIGAALQTAAVATTAVAAGAAAAAWAPAAALASLATGGANAAPAAAALTGTSALASTLAAVGGVGFMSGGYTGNMPTNKIAGAVHGREFVFDADATQRIGVDNLEAMRRNSKSGSGSSSGGNGGGSSTPSVVVNNYGTPQKYEVESISREEIRLIARDEVVKEAPKAVAGDLQNPNGRVSKSLQANTTAGRKRT